MLPAVSPRPGGGGQGWAAGQGGWGTPSGLGSWTTDPIQLLSPEPARLMLGLYGSAPRSLICKIGEQPSLCGRRGDPRRHRPGATGHRADGEQRRTGTAWFGVSDTGVSVSPTDFSPRGTPDSPGHGGKESGCRGAPNCPLKCNYDRIHPRGAGQCLGSAVLGASGGASCLHRPSALHRTGNADLSLRGAALGALALGSEV